LFGDDSAAKRRVLRDDVVCGYVATPDVFCERTANGIGDLNRQDSFVFRVLEQSVF
jgi:hypothetical protein